MPSCISLCVDTIPLFEDVLVKRILRNDDFTCTAALRMSRWIGQPSWHPEKIARWLQVTSCGNTLSYSLWSNARAQKKSIEENL